MSDAFQIGVIIATAFQRTDLLCGRSLKSVLNQTTLPDFVVIVDDNQDSSEFDIVHSKIRNLNLPNIFCIRNSKTKHNSGTGAWNTGIEFLQTKFDNLERSYIAILDDDDEWDKTYLEKCAKQIENRGIENTKAVFANLVRLHKDFEVQGNLSQENLIIENFLIGNPSVQGSNMFFNLQSFLDTGGFDENLKSCTDRDLMIRFLQQNLIENIAIINETLVYHYAQSDSTVTNNHSSKWAGLDGFYRKYLNLFTVETLEKSIERAEKYFAYPNGEKILNGYNNREKIVLAMPLHNGKNTIRRAVLSFVNQKNVKRKLVLIIGNDNSTDSWQQEISNLLTENVIIINIADGGNSYKTRNVINDHILNNIENVAYIGRLDADDELADEFVISKLEQIIDKDNPDVILAGNYQRKYNKIVGINTPDKNILNEKYLLERLHKMSCGIFKAELPSCNIFVKPDYLIKYPDKESAEDHWFTIELLKQKEKLKIHIADTLLYCIYSLDGFVTKYCKKNNYYLQSRIELFEYYTFFVREKSLENVRKNWKNYITSDGLSFHIQNIKTNKEKLKLFWNANYPLNKNISNIINSKSKKNIRLLDVGCGPFPKSGLYLKGYNIERVLVDAMAKEYHLLLEENGINTNNQYIINCHAENLETLFCKNSFDIIFSRNALDHTYNPIKAILDMVNLICVDGTIVLEHFNREGEYTKYSGLHQWNFHIQEGCFFISNKEKTIVQNINDLFLSKQIESYIENNKIITIIKNKEL